MDKKLMAAGLSLGLSLVLLASASFAWFTISTNPEISGMQVTLFTDIALLVSQDGREYGQVIYLSDEFSDYVGLKPVSTVDGVNWFLPAYDDFGDLLPVEYFIWDEYYEALNVLGVETDEDGFVVKNSSGNSIALTGQDWMDADAQGYYVSTTFWLKTEEENGVQVRLSVPDVDNEYMEDWEFTQGTYGSYALANYTFEMNEDETSTLAVMNQDPQTALRAGFLIQNEEGTTFTIYEPNADQRSSVYKPTGTVGGEDPDANGYIIDYEFEIAGFEDGMYIPTLPIGFNEDGETPEAQALDPNHLAVQATSEWDEGELQTALEEGNGYITGWSNYVGTLGRFVEDTTDLTLDSSSEYDELSASALASENVIVVTLEQDEPVMVTLFIWIEGQDVDCWNDIAASSVVLNLELAAELLPAPTTEIENETDETPVQ